MVSLCVHVFILLLISCVWVIGNQSSAIQLVAGLNPLDQLDERYVEIVLSETVELIDSRTVEVLEEPLMDLESTLDPVVEDTDSGFELAGWTSEQVSEPTKRNSSLAASPGSSFFGIPPIGDRIVYIIDMSPSMQVGKYQTRYSRAVNEVIHSVEQLREDQKFFVIMFSFNTVKIKLDKNEDFCFANEENVEKLRKRLRQMQLSSGTDPREAIVAALKLAPTCIYLLSDGEFNGNQYGNGVYGNRVTALELSKKRNLTKCPIHTVGLEDPRTQEELTQISKWSGGTHVFIPAED
jgi:hypothetical protein